MNIAIFNLKFSNNVGDGIIAETTEYLLGGLAENTKVHTLDLGGRTEYGGVGIKAPSVFKNMVATSLKYLPSQLSDTLRQKLTNIFLKRDALPMWRDVLGNSDRLVIGGGHLISDAELYFPIRLHALMTLAKEMKKPVYLHAVGVSNPDYFSPMGRKLFLDIFQNNPYLRYVSVRDELSREHWLKIFGGEVDVVPDPGNFTRETYQSAADVAPQAGVIGVGVMASGLVTDDTPGNHQKVVLTPADYCTLGIQLLNRGFTPLFFTNGSPADEVVLNTIRDNFSRADQAIFADRPIKPEDLVKIIFRCEKIIAYRLHACIVATSLGVPAIGLAWDKKLYSYFESVGAEDRVISNFKMDVVVDKLLSLKPLNIDFSKAGYSNLIN